jgi:transcriptional regulator with XRE-family HTH domain
VSRQRVCNRLAAMGIRIDQSQLHQYEHGTVSAPDPRVLWGLAHIYGVSLESLVIPLLPGRGEVVAPMASRADVALSDGELKILEWFRGLDARKQAAALQFLPLFGALDGVQARHQADAKTPGAHDEPATDPTVRASLRQAETPIALARKQR